ncbi:hypothetical protein [Virgibacillus sp. SK37]|uniref:hypothetical protein n=2 Tax=Virgibacillus TaxID=84406 RepID=UPI0004D1D58E|nr:hypothetical protein [Virgibacillus sp. SK37]AIF45520.1 hypothetical protein X953_15430 [Virgibacillus sp. SK37]
MKKHLNKKKKAAFSVFKSFFFFLKANCILGIVLLLFLINYKSWDWDGADYIYIFMLFPQAFLVLLAIIAGFRKTENKFTYHFRNSRNEWIGLVSAITAVLLFSLLFLGAGVAFPSTVVFLAITTNFMVAAFSVIFHPLTIALYEANVFDKCNTKMDYFYKYIAIFTTGINYHTQQLLRSVPLVINKLLAVIFVLLLIWQLFGVNMIFGD